MKITLDTKFDIGDTVYAVDHYYDFYATLFLKCYTLDVVLYL